MKSFFGFILFITGLIERAIDEIKKELRDETEELKGEMGYPRRFYNDDFNKIN